MELIQTSSTLGNLLQFVCLDVDAEFVPESDANEDPAALLFSTLLRWSAVVLPALRMQRGTKWLVLCARMDTIVSVPAVLVVSHSSVSSCDCMSFKNISCKLQTVKRKLLLGPH